MRIYLDKYKSPVIPDDYNTRDVLDPYEATNIDYIFNEIQYRNKLVLENDGETFQIWKRLRSGTRCDNPNCGASKGVEGAPNASCARCLGVGYIGGYEYAGETLIRIAPAGLFFTVTQGGLAKIHNPRTWTFPEPELYSQDILIAVDQQRIVNEQRIIDEAVVRRADINANFDSLSNTGVSRIIKITDIANSSSRYTENIDYQLSNNGVLWLTNDSTLRPDLLDTYYVSYIIANAYIRRYEITNVVRSTWRGKILHQELELQELDINHVAYNNISAEDYDESRYLNPFPYSNWFERES